MTSEVYEKQTNANTNSHITETCIDTSMNSKGMPAQVLVPTNVDRNQTFGIRAVRNRLGQICQIDRRAADDSQSFDSYLRLCHDKLNDNRHAKNESVHSVKSHAILAKAQIDTTIISLA